MGGAHRRDVHPVERHLAGVGTKEPAADVEQCRLAGTIRPDETGDASRGSLNPHAVEGHEPAETYDDVGRQESPAHAGCHPGSQENSSPFLGTNFPLLIVSGTMQRLTRSWGLSRGKVVGAIRP